MTIKRVLVHICLFSLSAACIFPIWIMAVASFKEGGGVLGFSSANPFSGNLSLQNYILVWRDGNFGRYFLNSVMVTFFITVGNMIFDSMAAYALARRKFVGQYLLMGIIISKLMIPSVVLMVPTFILINELGLYNTYGALILPLLTETFGIFLIRQYMLSIPKELEDAARLEGAGAFRIFFTVVLPLCMPVMAVVAIHSVMMSWNMYIYPLILTSSDSMRTLPIGLAYFRASNWFADTSTLMAGSMLSATPIILFYLIFQRKIISGLTKGAVKG